MHRLLITGIPVTGKTTAGDYLARKHGFEHLDFEHMPTLIRFVGGGEPTVRSEIDALLHCSRDVVVTWGFVPGTQLPAVLLMRELGFDWVWFDGNRPAARRAFLARGTVPEAALDIQLRNIAERVDLAALRPRMLDTFDANGEFRPLDEIAADLLAVPPEAGTERSRSAA